MELRNIAANLLIDKIDSLNDASIAEKAVGELLDGAHEFDLTGLVESFMNSNEHIAMKTKSWLGDRLNKPISADELEQALGKEKVDTLAARLDIDRTEVAEGLSEMVPQLIDMSSRGGNLLYSVGGCPQTTDSSGLFNLASRLLKQY